MQLRLLLQLPLLLLLLHQRLHPQLQQLQQHQLPVQPQHHLMEGEEGKEEGE